MIIYISIPMTGKDMEVQRKIAGMWQSYFESQKCEVLNPFQLAKLYEDEHAANGLDKPTYEQYLQYDLWAIENATHIFLCLGWENSNGCLAEVEEAMKHNIKYLFERDFKYC